MNNIEIIISDALVKHRLALLSSIQEELKKRHREYNPLSGINTNLPELRPEDFGFNQALSVITEYLESLK